MTPNLQMHLGWFVDLFSSPTSRIEFHRKVHAQFTNTSGECYIGIAPSISITGPDLKKPSQSVLIIFDFIAKVSIMEDGGQQRYTPVHNTLQRNVEMKFEVRKIERITVTENGATLEKFNLTIEGLPDERLILSFDEVDFARFNVEILEIESVKA